MGTATARLVGRDADLHRLVEAAMRARDGVPRCVVVAGEAGIGKTRLVAEAVAGLEDALVVFGRAADMSTGEIPFGVLADTLHDLVRLAGADVLTVGERDALAPLLPGSASGDRADRVQLLSAFADLLERLASQRLLVWVVEDLHWADAATRDLVNLAARTLRGMFLLVATVRTEDPERSESEAADLASYVASLARVPGCEFITLSRLTAVQVREQLRGLLDGTVPREVAARIEQLSDGVPFVVEELAAAAGRPELTTASAVAGGRLASLSHDSRRLVEAAAVGDGHLRVSLLEQVVDLTPDELDVALVEGARAGILVSDASSDEVGFRHPLLREATDRATGPGARRAWHRRWAEVLEGNQGVLAADPAALAMAEHWHQARDVRQSVSAAYAAIAAAERLGAHEERLELWRRVVEGWDDRVPGTPVARLTLREALYRGVEWNEGSRVARAAFLAALPEHELGDQEVAAVRMFRDRAAVAKGDLAGVSYDISAAVETRDWLSDPPDGLTVLTLAGIGANLPAGDPRSEIYFDRARRIATDLDDIGALVQVGSHRSWHLSLSNPAGAVDYLTGLLAELRHAGPEQVVNLVGNLIWALTFSGRHREADEHAAEFIGRVAHPELMPDQWEHVVENITCSWLCTGQWQRARDLLARSLSMWEDDLRNSHLRADHLDLLQTGTASLERWRTHLGAPIPFGPVECVLRQVLALQSALRGNLVEARLTLSPAWETDPTSEDDVLWQIVVDAARMEADAAMADARRDDRDEAAAHLGQITEVAAACRRFDLLGEVWPLDLAAQVDRFHGRDARASLLEALSGWERVGHVPDVAVTHLSLAEQEALHGDRQAARDHLVAGAGIARSLEARPMLDRADRLAERYGLAGRRRRRTDEVLTEREAEVLRLLAEGRTNAEIADSLFMSPKTASVHVSRIIAKLGAANRTEAAALARRHGLLAE